MSMFTDTTDRRTLGRSDFPIPRLSGISIGRVSHNLLHFFSAVIRLQILNYTTYNGFKLPLHLPGTQFLIFTPLAQVC